VFERYWLPRLEDDSRVRIVLSMEGVEPIEHDPGAVLVRRLGELGVVLDLAQRLRADLAGRAGAEEAR
jgi:microsomal dipeptidase-like Zn-dependent dipeptidase